MRYLAPLLLCVACGALAACSGDDQPEIAPEDDSTPALTQPWPDQTEPDETIPSKKAPAPESAQATIKPATPDDPLTPDKGDDDGEEPSDDAAD